MKATSTAFLASIAVLAGCQPQAPDNDKIVQAVQSRVEDCRNYLYGMKTKDDLRKANVYVFANCMEIGACSEEEYYAQLDAIVRSPR